MEAGADQRHRRRRLAERPEDSGLEEGTWAPTFWRADGSHVYVGGLGFITSKQDPSSTRPAKIVTDIYRRVIALQGDDGLLATEASQKHPNLSAWGSLDKVWDPSTFV